MDVAFVAYISIIIPYKREGELGNNSRHRRLQTLYIKVSLLCRLPLPISQSKKHDTVEKDQEEKKAVESD